MRPERLNAFTDGVLAIVITIMVLELPVPRVDELEGLRPIASLLGAYLLSFVNIGIYWNNHHHTLALAKEIDGRVMWANLALLFWLSLVPFVIRWIGEDGVSSGPTAAYGIVMVGASVSYILMEITLHRAAEVNRELKRALGYGFKEWASFGLYAAGIGLSFVLPWAAVGCYVLVAALWFLPDPRVEKALEEIEEEADQRRT